MGKQKKKRPMKAPKKSNDKLTKTIVLITAIINLFITLLNFIDKLRE